MVFRETPHFAKRCSPALRLSSAHLANISTNQLQHKSLVVLAACRHFAVVLWW